MREINHRPSRRGTAADGLLRDTSEAQPAHPAVLAAYRSIIACWVRQRREAKIIEAERARGVEAR